MSHRSRVIEGPRGRWDVSPWRVNSLLQNSMKEKPCQQGISIVCDPPAQERRTMSFCLLSTYHNALPIVRHYEGIKRLMCGGQGWRTHKSTLKFVRGLDLWLWLVTWWGLMTCHMMRFNGSLSRQHYQAYEEWRVCSHSLTLSSRVSIPWRRCLRQLICPIPSHISGLCGR